MCVQHVVFDHLQSTCFIVFFCGPQIQAYEMVRHDCRAVFASDIQARNHKYVRHTRRFTIREFAEFGLANSGSKRTFLRQLFFRSAHIHIMCVQRCVCVCLQSCKNNVGIFAFSDTCRVAAIVAYISHPGHGMCLFVLNTPRTVDSCFFLSLYASTCMGARQRWAVCMVWLETIHAVKFCIAMSESDMQV